LKFLDNFISYEKATHIQKRTELWDVKGILKKYSNREFKFDLRPISKVKDDQLGKQGFLKTKAEKMVFETKDQWVIIDIEELHQRLENKKEKIIYLDEILNNFEWNILINK